MDSLSFSRGLAMNWLQTTYFGFRDYTSECGEYQLVQQFSLYFALYRVVDGNYVSAAIKCGPLEEMQQFAHQLKAQSLT